jgi:hypothetical protein
MSITTLFDKLSIYEQKFISERILEINREKILNKIGITDIKVFDGYIKYKSLAKKQSVQYTEFEYFVKIRRFRKSSTQLNQFDKNVHQLFTLY